MLKLIQKDTLFVDLAEFFSGILHFMISKFLTSASMDYKVRMTSKLKDDYFS